jgi:hypothetical protein
MPELFGSRGPNGAASNGPRIRRWVRGVFALDEEATVMVTELRCSEPGCPPIETVIAILSEGANRQYRLHKRVGEIDEDDVRGLVGKPALSSHQAKSIEKGGN